MTICTLWCLHVTNPVHYLREAVLNGAWKNTSDLLFPLLRYLRKGSFSLLVLVRIRIAYQLCETFLQLPKISITRQV